MGDRGSVGTAVVSALGRRFLIVWIGQCLSTIGSTLSGVGVAVYVYLETGSATWLGILAAISSLPFIVATPMLQLTDRYRRRTMMIAADTFAVVGPAVALVLALVGRLEIWQLGVAGFLSGIGSAFQSPAAQAAVPALVDPEVLDRANGLNQLGGAVGIVLGPVLATPLVAWWGIEAVLLVDIVTFFIAVGATAMVRFEDPPRTSTVDDDGTWRALIEWLRGAGRPFVTLLAAMSCLNFLLAFFNVAALVLATEVGGAARAGLVLGAGGAAMIIGSLISGQRGVGADRVGTIGRCLAAVGIGFCVASSVSSIAIVMLGIALALGSVPVLSASGATLFQERVPASMHGRMFALRSSIARALEPLGSVAAGFVVARLAEPAVRADGALASTVGAIIGTGDGRGAALVIGCVGILVVLIATFVLASTSLRPLRRLPAHDTNGAVLVSQPM
jgi:MFS family permease